jgi:hypothetical protein
VLVAVLAVLAAVATSATVFIKFKSDIVDSYSRIDPGPALVGIEGGARAAQLPSYWGSPWGACRVLPKTCSLVPTSGAMAVFGLVVVGLALSCFV